MTKSELPVSICRSSACGGVPGGPAAGKEGWGGGADGTHTHLTLESGHMRGKGRLCVWAPERQRGTGGGAEGTRGIVGAVSIIQGSGCLKRGVQK